jgi:hypothetical protein
MTNTRNGIQDGCQGGAGDGSAALRSIPFVDPIPNLFPNLFLSLDRVATFFKTAVVFTPAALALSHTSWSNTMASRLSRP